MSWVYTSVCENKIVHVFSVSYCFNWIWCIWPECSRVSMMKYCIWPEHTLLYWFWEFPNYGCTLVLRSTSAIVCVFKCTFAFHVVYAGKVYSASGVFLSGKCTLSPVYRVSQKWRSETTIPSEELDVLMRFKAQFKDKGHKFHWVWRIFKASAVWCTSKRKRDSVFFTTSSRVSSEIEEIPTWTLFSGSVVVVGS